MHCPNDGLAGLDDTPDICQWQHTLVNPVQMNDVGLGKFGQYCDIGAGIGYVNGKQVMFLEVVGLPDNDTLPDELPYFPPWFL